MMTAVPNGLKDTPLIDILFLGSPGVGKATFLSYVYVHSCQIRSLFDNLTGAYPTFNIHQSLGGKQRLGLRQERRLICQLIMNL